MLQEITFYNPEFLWLLILLPLLVFGNIKINKKKSSQLKISSIKSLGVKSFKIKIYPILDILRYLAISMLIIALSRPQIVDVSTQTKTSKGIDIVIAVDVSSSMLAQDLSPNRLDALKEVAKEFINDRVSDRIGLVVYAGESYTKTPVTSDKSIIIKSLEEIKFDGVIEDGTAIGMGLATAVNRLKDSKAKSKVIILLTDGVNNSGFIDPNTAADLALSYEIKTYTIGLGSNGNALAPIAINPNGTFRFGLTKVEIDEKLLESIAKKTGGLYFRATDNKRLKDIYQEINKLEKTEVEEFKYTNAQERYRVFVLISFVFVFIEWLLKSTFFKSFI